MLKQPEATSQLFTLRVWVEELENGRFEFRGTLKHILTGETHHFRDWPTLIHHIESARIFRINEGKLI